MLFIIQFVVSIAKYSKLTNTLLGIQILELGLRFLGLLESHSSVVSCSENSFQVYEFKNQKSKNQTSIYNGNVTIDMHHLGLSYFGIKKTH